MVGGAGFGRAPFNLGSYIGSIDLLMPEKTHGRSQRYRRGGGSLLELLRWLVAERRTQSHAIVIGVDERGDVSLADDRDRPPICRLVIGRPALTLRSRPRSPWLD